MNREMSTLRIDLPSSAIADHILMMDCYRPVDITDRVKALCDGHTAPRVKAQLPGPLQERRNGLLVPDDDLLHELVPDHEVGGGGVLVHKEQAAAGLQRPSSPPTPWR